MCSNPAPMILLEPLGIIGRAECELFDKMSDRTFKA